MSGSRENGDAMPWGAEIEQGIDAIDRLRGTMRRAGLSECADALDHVFVKCLKDYMSRKDAAANAGQQGGSDHDLN